MLIAVANFLPAPTTTTIQTYTSSKDLEYEAICARLSTVPHKSVLTEEQQRDIRSILKLDMEELDIAALKKISTSSLSPTNLKKNKANHLVIFRHLAPLSPNELSNIGVVETEACLMFGDTVAALHNIEAALTASEGTNYDAAHTCIDLLLSINGVKESGLTSEQTRRAITHARDSIRAEGPHFDYLRAIADTSDIAKTASLQALKGWLTLDSTAKGAFDIQMRATTQRCLQLLPPNQVRSALVLSFTLILLTSVALRSWKRFQLRLNWLSANYWYKRNYTLRLPHRHLSSRFSSGNLKH